MNMFKPVKATSVAEYLAAIPEPQKSEIKKLHAFILKTVPKLKPFFLSNMIGYGKYRYQSPSGREGDWAKVALASQKNYISLYICAIKDGKYVAETFKKDLPKANIGKSCVRFKNVADVDMKIVQQMLRLAEKYPMMAV